MNIKKLFRLTAVLYTVTIIAFSPQTSFAATGISGVTVTRISIYAGTSVQGAIVWISPALPNGTEGCTNNPSNQIWIDFSSTVQPDGKSLYASVMAAFLSGHQLTFGVQGCGDSGQLPLVYRVDVWP